MVQISSFLNILIFFLFLCIVTNVEGHIPCQTNQDCPRYFCPPPLTPICVKYFCKCK
ncbi:uncharacterized protein LOC131599287 [Vicia villosa]|uniref:uncharacterized protein LOC131599287 n=1 Tax=Vicia villosa TaxID=3911 RepID=UPI00273B3195|nr:uncharacterized protein LOC131599287 [Vicia villosa]